MDRAKESPTENTNDDSAFSVFPTKVRVRSYACFSISKELGEDYGLVIDLAHLMKSNKSYQHMIPQFKDFYKVFKLLREHFVIYTLIQEGHIDWLTGKPTT
jgi:hypothetical protein